MSNQPEWDYDVFISYSSNDKEWVRGELLKGIEKVGLRAFIDFRDFEGGAPTRTEMARGVIASRRTLVVLTPDYIKSAWGEAENIMVGTLDPANRDRRLIPVLKTSCEKPLWIGSLTHIDFTDGADLELAWHRLFAALGTWPQKLAVADINDVVRWGWDGEELLRRLIELDYLTTSGLTKVHEGDEKQWGPVFMNNPETWRLLITEPENIVGYWHIAPLFPRQYELAKAGQLLDSQITADTVRVFGGSDRYKVYFVQVCLLPQHRRPRHVQLLFKTFFEVLDTLSADGIFVSEICANAFTQVGASMCKDFNLELMCEHSEHGEMYGGPIGPVLKYSLAQKFPDLQKRYASEGLI